LLRSQNQEKKRARTLSKRNIIASLSARRGSSVGSEHNDGAVENITVQEKPVVIGKRVEVIVGRVHRKEQLRHGGREGLRGVKRKIPTGQQVEDRKKVEKR